MAVIRALNALSPRVAPDAFLAEGVIVIGDVTIGSEASVWYGSVLRGDVGSISIGARSNVQDLTLVHMTEGQSVAVVGDEVTIGHRVVIHGARVGNGVLVGTGAILLDGVEVGEEALVAAGTLLTPRTFVPPRTLVRGHPGKVVRDLTEAEWRQGRAIALRYVERARTHARAGQGSG